GELHHSQTRWKGEIDGPKFHKCSYPSLGIDDGH
ncbi:MAG: hypothetical protein ACI94O_000863, partial [Octadecabacter sp.]